MLRVAKRGTGAFRIVLSNNTRTDRSEENIEGSVNRYTVYGVEGTIVCKVHCAIETSSDGSTTVCSVGDAPERRRNKAICLIAHSSLCVQGASICQALTQLGNNPLFRPLDRPSRLPKIVEFVFTTHSSSPPSDPPAPLVNPTLRSLPRHLPQ